MIFWVPKGSESLTFLTGIHSKYPLPCSLRMAPCYTCCSWWWSHGMELTKCKVQLLKLEAISLLASPGHIPETGLPLDAKPQLLSSRFYFHWGCIFVSSLFQLLLVPNINCSSWPLYVFETSMTWEMLTHCKVWLPALSLALSTLDHRFSMNTLKKKILSR